ncbi:MAG: YceI family protein [Parvibaculum sp.]|nr:YceI family protein [Parvibaculum sp.]
MNRERRRAVGTMRVARLLVPLAFVLLLAGCTALKVVTHEVDDDPVKAPAGTYRIDPHHTSVHFNVDHLGFSRFVARFDKVGGTLEAVPTAPERSSLSVTIDAASIDTNVAELDEMLKGPDMFDAAAHPEITFMSTGLKRMGPAAGEMTGDLTIAGTIKPVTLDVTFNGAAPDPLTGDDTLGFSATGAFERSQWGLSSWWPAVGNEVEVHIEAEFIKPRD